MRDRAFRDYLNFAASRCRLLTVGSALIAEAAALPQKYPLKALDALHLAAAIRLNRELVAHQLTCTFISSDHQLLAAAHAEGLNVENPHDHSESNE